MELPLQDIFEQANKAIEQLWGDGEIPAHELEILIFALLHLNDVDIESMTAIFDGVVRRHKTLQRLRMEPADNVIPFPVKQ